MRDPQDVGTGRAPDADDEDFTLDGPLGGMVAALRAPVDFGRGVDDAVMAAVRLAPPLGVVRGGAGDRPARALPPRPAANPLVRTARWFARPRSVRVSPLGALLAAGVTFLAVLGLRREAPRQAQLARTGEFPAQTGEFPVVQPGAARPTIVAAATPAAAPARDTVYIRTTRFVLVAPDAKQVALVGDFNDWDHSATPLVRTASGGEWTVELPLGAGRYSYAFLVDGHRWTADPAAPRVVGDDFGRPSSSLTVRGA